MTDQWLCQQHQMIFTRTWLRYVRVFAIANPSVVCVCVCLSVTFVHRTQGVETFGNISSPLHILAILWPPYKILRRSSQGNPSVGCVKRKRGCKLERWWTYRRLYLINGKRYKIRPRVQLVKWLIGNDKWGIHCCNFQWPWPIRKPDFKVIGVFRRQ